MTQTSAALSTDASKDNVARSHPLAPYITLAFSLLVVAGSGWCLSVLIARLDTTHENQPISLTQSQINEINRENTQALVPGVLGGRRLRVGMAGGVRPGGPGMNRGPGGPGGRPPQFANGGPGGPGGPRPMPMGGVVSVGNTQMIRTGQYLVTVLPAAPGFAFRQLYSQQALTDPLEFVIVRRIVHEPSVASQLAITPQQMQAINKIYAMPAVQESFVVRLPIDPAAFAEMKKAWLEYEATPAVGKGAAEASLIQSADRIGNNGVASARQSYASITAQIDAVLTPLQIQAYKNGKNLGAPPSPAKPKPATTKPKPATKPSTRPATTKPRAATRPATRPTTRPATRPAGKKPSTRPTSTSRPASAPATT